MFSGSVADPVTSAIEAGPVDGEVRQRFQGASVGGAGPDIEIFAALAADAYD